MKLSGESLAIELAANPELFATAINYMADADAPNWGDVAACVGGDMEGAADYLAGLSAAIRSWHSSLNKEPPPEK